MEKMTKKEIQKEIRFTKDELADIEGKPFKDRVTKIYRLSNLLGYGNTTNDVIFKFFDKYTDRVKGRKAFISMVLFGKGRLGKYYYSKKNGFVRIVVKSYNNRGRSVLGAINYAKWIRKECKGTNHFKGLIKGNTHWYFANLAYKHRDYNKSIAFKINDKNNIIANKINAYLCK